MRQALFAALLIAAAGDPRDRLGFCFSVLCRWLSTQSTGRPDICKDVQ